MSKGAWRDDWQRAADEKAELEARLERLQRVIAELVPEDERNGVGLSVGSLKALQSMAASQSDAACQHEWTTAGFHTNEYCAKCFVDRPKSDAEATS